MKYAIKVWPAERCHISTNGLGWVTVGAPSSTEHATTKQRARELARSWKRAGYVVRVEPDGNVPCVACGRADLPVHVGRRCGECGPDEGQPMTRKGFSIAPVNPHPVDPGVTRWARWIVRVWCPDHYKARAYSDPIELGRYVRRLRARGFIRAPF